MAKHAVLWIDHHEAHVLHLEGDTLKPHVVKTPAHAHSHHREPSHEGDPRFYADVAEALAGADEVLVVGPAKAKLEFLRYAHVHAKALEPRIVGVETVDHPTDGQLVAYARKYFLAADRMR